MGMHDHFAPFWTLVSRFAGSRGVALGFHILCLWHRMALFWSLRFPAFAYTSRLAGTALRLVRPTEIRVHTTVVGSPLKPLACGDDILYNAS